MKPGLVAGIVLVAEALVIDVVLKKMGHDSISTCVREDENGRRAVRWLSAHLTDNVRGDPLVALGRLVFRA